LGKSLDNFAKQFNEYLEKQNNSNREVNIVASLGYLFAALTALFSFLISFEKIDRWLSTQFKITNNVKFPDKSKE
jgi:hypothetical protein